MSGGGPPHRLLEPRLCVAEATPAAIPIAPMPFLAR